MKSTTTTMAEKKIDSKTALSWFSSSSLLLFVASLVVHCSSRASLHFPCSLAQRPHCCRVHTRPHPSAFPINPEGSRSQLGSSKPCKPRRQVGHPPTNMEQRRKFADDCNQRARQPLFPVATRKPWSLVVLEHGPIDSFLPPPRRFFLSLTAPPPSPLGRLPAGNVEVAGRD